MAAVYPTSIRNFFYKQDFVQIVDASDVNTAYDEINAVQNTLGVMPNTDTIDGSVVNFTTVKNNIADARLGTTKPICKLHAADNQVPNGLPNGTGIYATFTSQDIDTHNMWVGGGTLICPRTGWYDVQFYVEWQWAEFPFDNSIPPYDLSGYASVGIQTPPDTLYKTGHNAYVQAGQHFAIRGSGATSIPWVKGQSMVAQLAQTIRNGNQPCNLYLSVTYVRNLPGQ